MILWTGWTPIDPLLSVLVAVLDPAQRLVLVGSQATSCSRRRPRLDAREMKAGLMADVPGVEDVHHVHVWSLTEGKRMVTLHARVAESVALPTRPDLGRGEGALARPVSYRPCDGGGGGGRDSAVCGDAH